MDSSFYAGFMHPLMRPDHLLAMFAIGLWSFEQGKQLTLALPILFIAMLTLGTILALCGVHIPFISANVAMVALVVGILIATAKSIPVVLSLMIISICATLYGSEHIVTLPKEISVFDYGFGFLVATSLINALGVFTGQSVHHFLLKHKSEEELALRIGGTGIALAGGVILTGLLSS
ncbi:MAG: hypothetical protein COC15_00080 [Legionellales bacterium]|nr:MAG: hypothetical protein COC15_00080 [Legionellales bacterium]